MSLYERYVTAGVSSENSRELNIAIQNGNKLLILAIFTVVFYVVNDIFVGDWLLLLVNLGTIWAYIASYFLFNFFSPVAGASLALITANLTTFITADSVGHSSLIGLYHLPALLAPLLIFDRRHASLIATFTIFGFVFWLFSFSAPDQMIMPKAVQSKVYSPWIPIFMSPWCAIVVLFQTYKQFQDLLQQSERDRSELIQKNRLAAVGEMAGGVAHEINNPLQIIAGSAEQILLSSKEKAVDPIIQQRAERILSTVNRIAGITSGLLKFSKPETSASRQTVGVRELIEDTLAICSDFLRSQQIEIKVSIDNNFSIFINQDQLTQALLALIQNSKDAVLKQQNRWVEISAFQVGKKNYIAVTDSGAPIASDIIPKLMQPFFTTKPVGQGTGLGLSISKGLIESNSGKLFFDTKSEYTKFVIELPTVNQLEATT